MRELILAAFIISIFSTPVYAEVYKCTSQTGTIIYQQSPCVQDNKQEEIDVNLTSPSAFEGLKTTRKYLKNEKQIRKKYHRKNEKDN